MLFCLTHREYVTFIIVNSNRVKIKYKSSFIFLGFSFDHIFMGLYGKSYYDYEGTWTFFQL